MRSEILSTFLVFLTSANREIVKSTLGFVKLAIHTLPTAILRPQLPQMVPALLNWSHDHKNHFKEKVRHIFERLLRRFSFDEVYAGVGEHEEAGKFLINIKKRKDRVKRKKAQRQDEDEDEDEKASVFLQKASILYVNIVFHRSITRSLRPETPSKMCCMVVKVISTKVTRTIRLSSKPLPTRRSESRSSGHV
jgi:hypothetical protein